MTDGLDRGADSGSVSPYGALLKTGCQLFGMETGVVSLVAGEIYTLEAVESPVVQLQPGMQFPLAETYCREVISSGKPVVVQEAGRDPELCLTGIYQSMKMEAYVAAPVYVGQELHGTLCFASQQVRRAPFERWTEQVVTQLAESVGQMMRMELEREARAAAEEVLLRRDWALHYASNGIIITDPRLPDNPIVYVNSGFERLTGYLSDEVIGKNCRILQADCTSSESLGRLSEAIAREESSRVVLRNRRKDGTLFWNQLSISPIHQHDELIGFVGVLIDVTDQRRQQHDYEELSELRQAILSSAAHSIISTDRNGLITTMNAAAETMLGYTQEEMVGKMTPEAIHVPDEVIERAAELSKTLGRRIKPGFEVFTAMVLEGSTEESEWTYVRKDGTRLPVRVAVSAITDSDGEMTGFLGIAVDITREKEAERQQRQSDALFRVMCESSPVGIFVTDARGDVVYLNPQYETIMGYTQAESMGSDWDRAIHPDDRAWVRSSWYDAAQQGANFSREFRAQRPSGEVRWIQVNASPTIVQEGVSGYVGIVEDVTDSRRAAEEIRLSRERLQAILKSAADGIVTANEDGGILEFNPAAEEIFGYTKEEVKENSLAMLLPRSPSQEGFLHYVKNHGLHGTGASIIVVGRRKNAEEFPLELSISGVDVGGELLITAIMRDITVRTREEAEILAARDEAQRANQAKSEFLANMSHEIRTPMNAIIGFTECLLAGLDGPLNEEQTGSLTQVAEASQTLLRLINDVLDVSKIEAGKLELHVDTFDLVELVRQCLRLVQPMATRKSLVTDMQVPDVPVVISADRGKVEQILTNLFNNAVKFTEKGSVRVSVSVDNGAVVTVTDTGIGMDEEVVAKVFDAFTQGDSSTTKTFGGTGLGLTIARRLARLHGGEIAVESVRGEGSTFTLTLPGVSALDDSTFVGGHDDG